MNQNDIVSVITPAGEFIGKLAFETDTRLKLNDPRMLITTNEGMGFARGAKTVLNYSKTPMLI